MMKSIVESTDFNVWNFDTSINQLIIWNELLGVEFVIDGGYVVAIGKEAAND